MRYSKSISTSLIAVSLLCSTTAFAANTDMQGGSTRYLSISGQAEWPHNSDAVNNGTGNSGNVDFDMGWNGNVALGFLSFLSSNKADRTGWGAFRGELEAGYHNFGIDSVTSTTGGTVNPSADLQAYSYMANVYYDMRNFMGPSLVPYIGAGAGGAYINMPRNTGLGATDNTDNVFAYQFMAGVSFVTPSMPTTDFYAGYRYFATSDPSFGSVDLDRLSSNNAEVGVRFHF